MDYFASDQASHTSKGPGWWLASDGVWYAPELRPSAGGSAGTMSPGLAGTDIAQQWPQTDTAGLAGEAPFLPSPPSSSSVFWSEV
jgi:hypothetical protein